MVMVIKTDNFIGMLAMIVSELIEFLTLLNQNAIVEVLEHKAGTGYYDQGGTCRTVEFNPVYSEYYDCNGKAYLSLGVMNA